MRILLILLSVIAFAPGIYCEQEQQTKQTPVLVYPRELLNPLPVIHAPDPNKKEEFVEVESEAYPGLNLDLPQLDQMIAIEKYEIRPAFKSAEYYQTGGNPVLSYYGILAPSGQLLSVPVTGGSTEKEKE